MSEQARAWVTLIPTAKGFASKVQGEIGPDVEKAGKQAGKQYEKGASGGIGKVKAALAGAFIGGAAVSVLKGFVSDARESAKIGKLSAQVIKTTGGAAHLTADQVGDLATAISNKTGVDDEAIQSGENLLLTFTNVRNEVGKGNDIFNQATGLVTDMSVALGQDAKAGALQLGKALNDPIKGVGALSRVGVSFTAQQKKQIETLVKSGDTLGAQKIILTELGKEFGGAAAAAATPGDRLKVVMGNLSETLGGALLPTVDKVARFLVDKLIPAATQVFNVLFKGDFTGGGPFMEDSPFIANVFAVRDAFLALIAFVKSDVLPVVKSLGTFLMEDIVPALITVAKFVGRNKDFFGPFAVTILAIVGALKAWAAAQAVLNIVMTANPIGLVVVAIAALVAGLVWAYRNSETFRKIVTGAFDGVKAAAVAFKNIVIEVVRFVANAYLKVVGTIVGAAAKAFGWVPGIGPKLKAAAKAVEAFRDDVNDSLDGLKDKTVHVTILSATGTRHQAAKNRTQLERIEGRASGGPMVAGQPYLVGEQGWEVVVPDQPSTVLNQRQILAATATGGGEAREVHHHEWTINNPVPETAPTSAANNLRRLGFVLGAA